MLLFFIAGTSLVKMRKKILYLLWLVFLSCPWHASAARTIGTNENRNSLSLSYLSVQNSDVSRPKKQMLKSKKSNKVKKNTPSPVLAYWKAGIGLSGGWEAPFGNGFVLDTQFKRNIQIQLGIGYNLSGMKMGMGCDYLVTLSKNFLLPFGLAFVRSNGVSGTVSIDGSFTSETGDKESIQAKRKFILSPALYLSPKAGVIYNLYDNTDIYFLANYNVIVWGNKVKFTGDITYNQDIAVINEEEALRQFEDKASEKVRTGGFGVQLGFTYWF